MKYLDVTTLEFNQEQCISCNRCIEVCPHQVFSRNEKIEMTHKDRCIECGACQMNCPTSATKVEAGTGCATAIILNYLKQFKFLAPFIKDFC